ncbi:MAG TPA: SGNH/GDSL hydrolase family protein, partial [Byssovorax sp.]
MARALVASLVAALAGCADARTSRALSSAAPSTPAPAASSSTSRASRQTTTAPARAVRYLALGDSFTIGTGSSPAQAFPARLAARIEATGVSVALENLGVNGFTTEDLERVELPHVAEFAPNLVTLAIGANDLVHGSTVEAYQARVGRILDAIVARGVPA